MNMNILFVSDIKLWKCVVPIFIKIKKNEVRRRFSKDYTETRRVMRSEFASHSHLFPAYHRYKGPKSDMSMIVQLLRKQVYFWNLQSMKLKTEQLLQLLSRNILLLQLLRRKMIVLQWVMLILRNCFTWILLQFMVFFLHQSASTVYVLPRVSWPSLPPVDIWILTVVVCPKMKCAVHHPRPDVNPVLYLHTLKWNVSENNTNLVHGHFDSRELL